MVMAAQTAQDLDPTRPPRRAYDRYAAAAFGFIAGVIVTGLFITRKSYYSAK